MKYRVSLFCLFLYSFCIYYAFGACPGGSIDGKDGYCYKIGSTSAVHADAIKSCDGGFHLPKVLNAASNVKVKDWADVISSDVWLGASCDDNLNCKWDDGSKFGFDFWLSRNPNVINGKCVALTTADGTGKWQSVGCDADTKKGVVCQIANVDIPATTVPVGSTFASTAASTSAPIIDLFCDNALEWKDGGDGNCYEYAAAALIFDDAVTKCYNDGGQLPKIMNKLTNAEVQKLATDQKTQIWLGLTCQPDGSCKWNDGTPLTYSNWIDGTPDVTEGACATMKLSGSHAGQWESADCNFDKGVFCQKAATVITSATTAPAPEYYCASGFILAKDHRCYLPFVMNDAANFNDAYTICKSRSAQLAIIENDQQNLIYQQIISASGDGHLNAYLGLTYSPTTNKYTWVDGTVPDYKNFSPANDPSFGNCVEIFLSGNIAPKWLNTDCESVLPFACVAQASTTSVSTIVPPSGPTPATVVPPFNCNYEYFNSETVKSPNYPKPYPASIECNSLMVVEKYYVSVTFQNFSLKWGDYIHIFDGPHSGYPLLFRIQAGSAVVNQSFTTATSNKMLMRFVSAAGPAVATGFMAYFQPELKPYTGPTLSPAQNPTTVVPWIGTPAPSNPYLCPDPSVFKSSGLIASPGYPQRFGTALSCFYYLQADPDADTISITFGPIDIDPNFDVLNLYDGNSTDSTRLARLGPTNKTVTYTSTKPYLLVDFRTGSSDYHGTGFVASFTSISSHTIKPPPTASTGECRTNWQKDTDFPYCYKYHSNAMIWDQAQATCKRDDADLVAITRTLQQLSIYQYINGSQYGEKTYPVYIGFYRDGHNNWEWVDGTYKQDELWLPGEPSYAGDCAAIRMATSTTKGGWYAVNCAEALPFVCYYEIRTQLPPN